ncbi:peptide-methionine (S)-S-oxide reductase [Malassezia japonica]|uniref:peptide-methionine (S)-S-oxide reductase n=1 Tax=Malassezia japonica TaxID=223818 RepID=A0AAF0EZW9_9BASI|nr:peptide-methionine (S)-S-oxide reductase [Malassezia japonica]WFD40105.1 peptide-methionine (S)-S-oxide reductase [Malassezia japonica]
MSTASANKEVATFANGCFWGTEHIFKKHFADKGLLSAEVGYIGGDKKFTNPTYEEVCTGKTGHAEAAQLVFDPAQVQYADLVEFFYRSHDPTEENAQGPDRGTQYRSAIFAHTPEQERIAQKVTQVVQSMHFDKQAKRIVTQIQLVPESDFHRAESYHQEYLFNNPSGYHCPTHRLWW